MDLSIKIHPSIRSASGNCEAWRHALAEESQIVRSQTAQWLGHVQEEREGPATGKRRNTLLTMDC